MDGTIEELREVLLSMEHRKAVAILDETSALKAKGKFYVSSLAGKNVINLPAKYCFMDLQFYCT